MKTSLGLLEVSGLALAIGAADAMAKAASVQLVGMEKTNGSGWMLLRLTGDVASVQAAITTGAAFAAQRNGLVAQAVLARPADSLLAHWQPPRHAAVVVPQIPPAVEEQTHSLPTLPEPPALAETPVFSSVRASCNLCQDPACQRKKGDPRDRCLHSVRGGKA
ncbi:MULTISPECIES: BMC domain-containing protein [unclassified Serratia (in: enterobacteria)]|uniref:BMC domain-containing protein n=1 Tax=unclassified Serratia (in: enterobacteria) TaxID=2647522 RepID=UPI003076043B